jgi:MFS family permease
VTVRVPATDAPGRIPDEPCADCLDHSLATTVGAIFLGSLASANRLAPPERRGQAISASFVACYAGMIIPVIGVGVLSGFTGIFPAVLAFSLLLAVLCLFCVASIRRTLGAR